MSRRMSQSLLAGVVLLMLAVLWGWNSAPGCVGTSHGEQEIQPGAHVAEVRAGVASWLPVPTPETVSHTSRPKMMLTGRIISEESGDGIPGAEISIQRLGRIESIRSGVDGRFSYEPPISGEYSIVRVVSEGFQPFAPSARMPGLVVSVDEEEVVDGLVLALKSLGYCEGVVHGVDGRPVSNAKIRFLTTGRWDPSSGVPESVESNLDGQFKIPFVPDALLQAELNGTFSGIHCLCIASECPFVMDLDADAAQAELKYVEGHVLDSAGHPVAGVQVSATDAEFRRTKIMGDVAPVDDGGVDMGILLSALEMEPRQETVTDDDGSFLIGPLEEDEYDVFVSKDPESMKTVKAGARDVRLRLPPAGQISGRVVSELTGEAVSGFSYLIEKYWREGEFARGRIRDSLRHRGIVHDARGRFEISNLPAGVYRLRILADGFQRSVRSTVKVAAGERTQLTISLTAGHLLQGIVTDLETGQPLAGARISEHEPRHQGLWADAVDEVSSLGTPGVVETAADGSFRLTVTEDALWASSSGYRSWVVREPASWSGPLRIALSPLRKDAAPGVEFGGVGIVWASEQTSVGGVQRLTISGVLDGSPAERGGLAAGDAMLAVDGAAAEWEEASSVGARIRGEVGTPVRLRLWRSSSRQEYEVVLTRARLMESD
ncbi:hypothetical protein MYSTI_06100 [Myxococcus stipitatus DSM 14675]|uniref:PDZ domain-containing protein n=2 Tax=Myxococcus stipitatus TaxID=83455 RepID=L7UH92_MYXSD|nr:hypothetical protein MYSTI_06100 [Myxococcus stipitatus DSM 14675]